MAAARAYGEGESSIGERCAWWRTAVVYQVYPRSFADSDGDGIGDLPGITARLLHLADLGVDAVWLSPFYTSPMADAGYDVADHRAVDPLFGTLADADALLAEAARLGLRVIVDLVPNHTSDEHAWFRAALAAGPDSPERARYLFRDGRGDRPPNSWRSVFGGPAWTRVTEPDGSPGQWYLHLFDARQPDLDWSNPEVREEFHDILRFWLDRGVAGFRVDVAHGLVKAGGLPEWDRDHVLLDPGDGPGGRPPMWDQDGVHEIYREWRKIVDGYGAMLVGEAWVAPPERLARYVRADEMHQVFNFDFLLAPWRARDLVAAVRGSLESNTEVGAAATWVLSNHDVVRHPTRLTLPPGDPGREGIGPADPQPDEALGLRRGRAASAVMLALPGGAYLFQGEELGLPEHTTLPDDVRQDPTWFRQAGTVPGRDGCRVPVPWEAAAPAYGFSPSGRSWLPQPDSWARYAAGAQDGVSGSTLQLYRTMLRLRRELALGEGSLTWAHGFGDNVVAFRNGPVLVLTNLGAPLPLPDGEVLLATADLDGATLPTDATVWLREI
ncbi:MAG: glycoside hydrolase family 13 protein [Pseudonocardia sp.]